MALMTVVIQKAYSSVQPILAGLVTDAAYRYFCINHMWIQVTHDHIMGTSPLQIISNSKIVKSEYGFEMCGILLSF